MRTRAWLDDVSAHDLLQPLTAMKLQTDLLARRVREGTITTEELLGGLAAVSTRAGTIVDGLVATLGNGDGSPLSLRPTECDLGEVVRDVMATLDVDDRVRVTFDADGPVRGRWDAQRLGQVARNLVDNALKYSGGEIGVVLRADGDRAQLDVADHGIGLGGPELEAIFTRGYRSSRAVETGAAGIGIGLHNCRAIVEAHGGRIWAESDGYDRGARFRVSLPRVSQPRSLRAPRRSA